MGMQECILKCLNRREQRKQSQCKAEISNILRLLSYLLSKNDRKKDLLRGIRETFQVFSCHRHNISPQAHSLFSHNEMALQKCVPVESNP